MRRAVGMAMWIHLFALITVSDAALVDFESGIWNFGGPDVVGWQQPGTLSPAPSPFIGTTTLSSGVGATFTVTDVGSVIHSNANTANHLTTYVYPDSGNGLYLTQSSGSAYNSNSSALSNYLRIDIEVSELSYINFYVHDIDVVNGNWLDAVYAESFSSGFGAVGTGNIANYAALGTDLTTQTLHTQNLQSIRPEPGSGNPPSTIIDDADELTTNSAQINFVDPQRYISIYYWNRDNTASFDDNQLIHLSGISVFGTETVPEPSTWALMLITACGAIFLQYRKQRKLKLAADSAA